jgi:hypothetical protein
MRGLMSCSQMGWNRLGSSVLCLLGVVVMACKRRNGLLPDNRIIVGTVGEIAANQVKVYTAEIMPATGLSRTPPAMKPAGS